VDPGRETADLVEEEKLKESGFCSFVIICNTSQGKAPEEFE
jgi:hypothetical protein